MILVTGGTGFIGRDLVSKLSEVDDVRVLTRGIHTHAEAFPGSIEKYEDVLKACEDCDTVYHLAALGDHFAPWDAHYRSNVLGTKNVLDACEELDVDKVVLTGSAASDVKYKTHYGATKKLAEEAAEQYFDTLNVSIIKPGYVYDDKKAKSFAKIRYVPLFPNSKMRIHFTYKPMLVKAFVNARESKKSGKYLVLDKQAVALGELYAAIAPTKPWLPSSVLDLIRWPANILSHVGADTYSYSKFISYLLQDRGFDSKPAAKELKYTPVDTVRNFKRVLRN